MAERSQMRRTTSRDEETGAPPAPASDDGSGLKAELDDLLDEIDEVLETNAEEFVKNYIQKGGE